MKSENEKLGLFGNQVDQMRDDFEDMKRSREEAKKQLEAKFLDVHRYIPPFTDSILREFPSTNHAHYASDSNQQLLILITQPHAYPLI